MADAFNRSKFKGAKTAVNKAAQEEAESATAFTGGRAGYITIKEGKTIIRLAPPHDENNPALQPICKVWLPREIEDTKGVKIVKNMPIFNARVHSPLKRDIVDLYCEFTSKMIYAEHPKDEGKKRLAPINGWKGADGKWNSGIRSQLGYDAYAWEITSKMGADNKPEKVSKFGRINFNKTMVDVMNSLAIDESAEDIISTDPFSDPDTGVNLVVLHDKKATDKWKGNKGNLNPLTDDQLMELDAAEPLVDMLKNSYTREDFNRAVAGLAIFDEKAGYGVMAMEDFITIIEEVKEEIWSCPDIKESNNTDNESSEEGGKTKAPVKEIKKTVAIATKTVVKPKIADDNNDEGSFTDQINKEHEAQQKALSTEDDGLDDLNINELKEFATDNGLNVVIKATYPKSKVLKDIRTAIASKSVTNDLPFEPDEETDKEVKKTTTIGKTAKERMAALRNKAK